MTTIVGARIYVVKFFRQYPGNNIYTVGIEKGTYVNVKNDCFGFFNLAISFWLFVVVYLDFTNTPSLVDV